MSAAERYIPAAGRGWLTALYDPMMALTMRERAFRAALVGAALGDPLPQLVLDVGCGTGTLAVQLAQASASIEIVGVDVDEDVLRRARGKAAGIDGRVRFERGRADALPLADGTAEVVIASLLLHHLRRDSKERALREARRVLAPSGRLVVVDWGSPHDPLMRTCFFLLQLLDGFPNTRDHAAGRLPTVVAQAGFQAVTIKQRWRTAWGSLELITAQPSLNEATAADATS